MSVLGKPGPPGPRGVAGAAGAQGPAGPAPSSGAALPGSPTDGQLFVYEAAAGVSWLLRYRAATTDWEFIGGPPLYAKVEADEATVATHTTYQDLATVGPAITAPLAGTYDVEFGANMYAAAGIFGHATVKNGASAASDTDSVMCGEDASGGSGHSANSFAARIAAVAAGASLKVQYRSGTANATNWRRRWLAITPVRLDG